MSSLQEWLGDQGAEYQGVERLHRVTMDRALWPSL